MNIRFSHVVPHFINASAELKGDVWSEEFTLEKGRRYLVRASSGRGKSTMLGIVFGSRSNFNGNVFIGEVDVKKTSMQQWSEWRSKHISMLFQELRLFDMLTVRENLQLKLKLSDLYSFSDATECLTALGMESCIDRPCHTLSWGQQQRIAIVRSMLQPFEWLLMDEPFSHLDEKNIELAMKLITDQCEKQGAGLIISSLGSEHSQDFDKILEL